MALAAQAAEHVAGIVGINRFVEDVVAEDNDGVCCNNEIIRMIVSDAFRFMAGERFCTFSWRETSIADFVGMGCADPEFKADASEQFFPAW